MQKELRVIVASGNPVKIEATRLAFVSMFAETDILIEGVGVPSGVSDQPMSDAETLEGAGNRAEGAKQARPEADFWVGIEGGIAESGGGMLAFAWMVILGHRGRGEGKSAAFHLPPKVVELIRGGMELGEADDVVFGQENSKQSNGAVGLLTGDIITRTTLYVPALQMALIPFRRPELYQSSGGERPETAQ